MKEIMNKNVQPDSPEERSFELRRRAYTLIHFFAERKWQECAESKRKIEFLDKIIEGTIKLIPEAKEEINIKLRALNTFNETNNLDGLFDQVTEIVIEIMAKNLTLKEIEERLLKRSIEEKGNQVLSRGLHFKVHEDDKSVSLHIPVTFFEDAKSFLQSFTDGLKILASKMKTEKELENIKEVTGTASLVREKYRLLTSLGFTVAVDNNGKPTHKAKISREKLLELYGK